MSEASQNQPSSNPVTHATKIAATALAHIHEHELAPTPKAYEIWYAYAAGYDYELNSKIQSIIEQKGTIGTCELEKLHDNYFNERAEAEQVHADISKNFELELGAVLKLVQSGLETSEAFSTNLESTCTTLQVGPDADQIKVILTGLIQDNERMRSETINLNKGLQKSQSQIIELKSHLDEVREYSLKDPMTSLANRRHFQEVLAQEMARADEGGEPLSLVIADIDYFKKVNDTFGHLIGDAILKFFANLMVKNVKGSDTVARYGGEEFAIILPKTLTEDATHLIERIRSDFEKSNLIIKTSGKRIKPTTASFGITLYQAGETGDSFIQRADTNLYAAKNNGRNKIATDLGVNERIAS